MPTPMPTTTITILRPDNYADGAPNDQLDWEDSWTDPQNAKIVVSGVNAHIGDFTGNSDRDGANLPETAQKLSADPCDLRKDDWVLDDLTGLRYRVGWVTPRQSTMAPMLNRVIGGLERVDGATAGPPA